MKCPRCEHENPPHAKFCLECGARVALTCTKCRSELPAGAKFCLECGAPVAPQATAEPRFTSPESYTPKHLAEKILTSKAALEGERKQVTVLFADLKGSMELLADRDPEEARKILDPVLEHMMEAVHRYEGTVNQVMGDGIMALFGAPLAHEDHAVRACYAALRMQASVKRYAEEVHLAHNILVQIRVGLNSGDVVVRSIGSDLRMDYTAVGQTTHLAARMEQMARPEAILVTTDCLRLVEGYVVAKPLGPRSVKGLDGPVEICEIVGAATVRSRFQTVAARGLTPFVARESELDQLQQALEQARGGQGQVVAVVGGPGVGKSRLYWEFTRSNRTHGWLVVESGSVSYGKATNYLPVVELLKVYFQIEAHDDVEKISAKVSGKLLSLDPQLAPTLPAVLWLLDVPVHDPGWEALDPPQRRRQTLDGVRRVLLREAQVQPVTVVFEDLHWIDGETQAFLDGLVASLPTARLLLLVNYRPEYQHGWSGKACYRQLRIDPLPEGGADALLHALLGDDASLRPLKHLLIERTEGNPFFLEESVRGLVEARMLVGERGAFRLATTPATLHPMIQIPATAHAVLAARIDRLAPEDKRLLQSASVIGTDVPYPLLESIIDTPETELREGLARLQAAEFLFETRLFPDLEYTFKHALTHEVAYASVLRERQRALHERIVEAIEALHADRLVEHLERLAHHAFRGEVWDKAVGYLRQAGAKAFARSAHREAAAYFEQAIGVLRHLPAVGERMVTEIDLRLDLRNALVPLGEHGRIVDHLYKAEALAKTLDDQRRLGWASAYLSPSLEGDLDRAVASAERALAVARAVPDVALEVMARFFLGMALSTCGRYREAIGCLRRNMEILQGDYIRKRFGEPGLPFVFSLAILDFSLAEVGDFADGVAYGTEAIRVAESVDQPFTLIHGCMGLGVVYLHQGELDGAIRMLEWGLRVCDAADIHHGRSRIAMDLGRAYLLSGRSAEAVALQERIAAQDATRTSPLRSRNDAYLSESYLRVGRKDDAVALAHRALEFSRADKRRGIEAWVLRLLGEIAACDDPPDVERAEHSFDEASQLAIELGMRPLVAHCHLGLGKLYRRTGKREQAQEHLTTATTMYREMDMRFWLEKAEAEMMELT